MWKLRPLIDHLNNRFGERFHPEQAMSYDESMISYYGRHPCKQYIRGKPLRYGYKVWCLNTPLGYNAAFEIYQGKAQLHKTKVEKAMGKCAAPLLYLINGLPEAKRDLPYSIFFDNLFTGIPLLYYLLTNGYNGAGTIRED